MKRRDFLVRSAVLGGAGALTDPPTASAHEGGTTSRTLPAPPDRYQISVAGPSVTVDCFAAGADAEASPAPGDLAAAPLVALGSERQTPSWTVASWAETSRFAQAITLRAIDHPLEADLTFAFDDLTGILTRRTVLRHGGGPQAIDLHATLGLCVSIHEPVERIIYLTGEWQEEGDIALADPASGVLTLESRTGKTGFEYQPYAALRTRNATYLCQILWSGNWMLQVVPRTHGATLLGGFNNWRFEHRLSAGGRLELPTVLFGRFEGTIGGATRRLHDYRRAHRPNADRAIPVQFNSWYPYQGEPSAEALVPLIPLVKKLGCEVFVVDAGWYRTENSDSDDDWDQRTGDWRVSRQRFPNGLHEVSDRCRDAGLGFGLWFEPEVIGPASSLRTDHPEWLHYIDGKPPAKDARAILNLGVPQAWQHVFDRITRLLRIVGVDWMKWDFNADLGPGGWAPGLPEELTGQAPLVAHYEALYRLQDALRAAFPNMILEMCAGGGGRMDGGILSHAHVNWMSDQSSALRKLTIHFGTLLAHPAVVCNDWLIDWPGAGQSPDQPPVPIESRGDLPFRLRVAMLGTFGISAPIDRWSEADIGIATSHVALYKSHLRAIIHQGDCYALTRAPAAYGNSDWAALWYAAKDGMSGVLFAFRLAGADDRRVFPLRGLHKDRRYRVARHGGPEATMAGAELEAGLAVVLAKNFESALCLVEAMAD